jgi:GH25 family lysozyme M1 (1,4-beta-N-acetylmuramidase)
MTLGIYHATLVQNECNKKPLIYYVKSFIKETDEITKKKTSFLN